MTNYVSKKSISITAAVFATALYSSCVLADYVPEIQRTGDITYVTGGIGMEERDGMKAVKHDYNVHVLTAGPAGAYLGYIQITIYDAHNHQLVDTDSGPLFYARLPAGHYVVEESYNDQSKKQSIAVGADKPVSITFRWM